MEDLSAIEMGTEHGLLKDTLMDLVQSVVPFKTVLKLNSEPNSSERQF